MSKTVSFEELPADTQQVIELLLSSREPIIISRGGEPVGGLMSYDSQTGAATSDEDAEVKAAIALGEADYAAGRYLTLDEFKAKYADKLRAGEE